MKSRKKCHICKKGFYTHNENEFKNKKVRDRCHYTRKFRGAAHDNCNLRYKVQKNIPIIIIIVQDMMITS